MNGLDALAFGTPGGGELLVVLLAVLILFGAKRLPGFARTLGRTLEQFRRAAREVTDEITKATETPPAPPPENRRLPDKGPDHERTG